MLQATSPQVKTRALRSHRPVFVVGSPRSGTSLLYHTLLSSGSFAVYDEETHFFSGLATRVGNLAKPKNREKLLSQWLDSNYFNVPGLDLEELKREILNQCRNSGDFLRIVMDNLARRQNVQRWAEKTPDHVLYMHEIKRTLPDALIIHMVRDGRDVALSLDKIGFLLPHVRDRRSGLLVCGLYWQWMVEAGARAGATLGPDYLQMKYESLVQEPRKSFSVIGKFIGHDLDYDRIQQVGMYTVHTPNTSFDGHGNGDGFRPVQRWKRGFPADQLRRFESLVGRTLKKFGYDLSMPDAELSGNLQLWRLRAYYRSYFLLRHWMKSQRFPIIRGLIRDR